MATISLYLDKRRAEKNLGTLKITVCLRGSTATHSTGIKLHPEEWDAEVLRVVKHPQAAYLNTYIQRKRNDWEVALLKLTETGEAKKAASVTELKRMILRVVEPEHYNQGTFASRFLAFAKSRATQGNRDTYIRTYNKLKAFDPVLEDRNFEDIDRHYLMKFDSYMGNNAVNSRALHFRNIRAVFNDALADEAISCYPFRRFKIKTERTPKRALTVEQLRQLMTYDCEDWQIMYRDMFVLMFFLCGINAVDLFNASPDSIVNGRLEYRRAKTHKLYSIKVETEARDIIDRYRGKRHLLNIMDSRKNYLDYLRRMDSALKKIGPYEVRGQGGKIHRTPLFPNLSQYWCRHTWATIAASLDIPKETIAAALGHGGRSVTDIYIDFDRRKIDQANRRVIDYVLYDKG